MKVKYIIFFLFFINHIIAQTCLPTIEYEGSINSREERAIEQCQKLLQFKGDTFMFFASYKNGKIYSLPPKINQDKDKAILKYGHKLISMPPKTIPSPGYCFRLANVYYDKEYNKMSAKGFYIYILLLLEDINTNKLYLNRIDLNNGKYFFHGVYPYKEYTKTIKHLSDKTFYAMSKIINETTKDKYIPEYDLKAKNLRLKGVVSKDNKNYIVFTNGFVDYNAPYQDISISKMIKAVTANSSDRLYYYLEPEDKAIVRINGYKEEEKAFYAKREVEIRDKEQKEIERKAKAEIENQKAIDNWERSQKEYKQELIKKYGKRVTNLIFSNKVEIGWNKDMCVESWGMPDHINYTKFADYVQEQWIYEISTYLYFVNGKLTAIQGTTW